MNKAVIYQYRDYLGEEEVGRLQQLFEHNYETIARELDLKHEFPEIKYYLYPSVDIKKKETGEDANAHTNRDKFEVYMVYNSETKPTGPHELVHILTNHLGVPNYVFNEGLAEYFEQYWKGRIDGKMVSLDHDTWVRKYIKNNTYISISELFDDAKFWEFDEDSIAAYSESGSFLKYLAREYGLEKVMTAYSQLTRNNPDRMYNYKVFEKIFGLSMQQSEKNWLNYLSK